MGFSDDKKGSNPFDGPKFCFVASSNLGESAFIGFEDHANNIINILMAMVLVCRERM